MTRLSLVASVLFFPSPLFAADGADHSGTWIGILALGIFVLTYALIVLEERTDIKKSKPTLVAAGVLWVLVALALGKDAVHEALDHHLLEYAKILLFLLSAMTFVNTMEERNVFGALRSWLIARRSSLWLMFWLTGGIAFFLSPLIDNLTTALVVGSVVVAVGGGNTRFVVPACVNVVVAANAGGVWSPIGDITSTMVWLSGNLEPAEFLRLFVPSLANWLVPAILMSLAIPNQVPDRLNGEGDGVKDGGYVVVGLFALTVACAILGERFLGVPPVMGMMFGLGLLMLYGHTIAKKEHSQFSLGDEFPTRGDIGEEGRYWKPRMRPFNIFISMKRAEWDTLLFFFGIVLSVGALSELGHLANLSEWAYGSFGPTWTNVGVGVISAVVDNIPVVYAVIGMDPAMGAKEWGLVTLTAGTGGSLLSVGSAAGVALMGRAREYTFSAHLKWSWAILAGYAAAVLAHIALS